MSHKVHPKSFRIKGMEDWTSRGFYGNQMPALLQEDWLIKEYLQKKLVEAMIASVQIERSSNHLRVIIEAARPGVIIGRGGQGAEMLKKAVEKIRNTKVTQKSNTDVKIEIREVKNPWISAVLIAKMAVQQTEKRMPFRQIMKKSIERVMSNREVKGIRMEMSGRLNGTEIARTEHLEQGQMPRSTIRADIDYALEEAHCTYGKIGIKVWVYKGEKFDK